MKCYNRTVTLSGRYHGEMLFLSIVMERRSQFLNNLGVSDVLRLFGKTDLES
jgi:hypothetical protein